MVHSIANFGSYGNTLAVGVQVTHTAVLCSCLCICDNVLLWDKVECKQMAWPIGGTGLGDPLVQFKCTSFMASLLLLYSRFVSNWWSDWHDKLTSSIHCKARRTWQICERPTWQPLSKCPHHQTQTSYLLYRPCKSNKPSVRTVPYNKVSKRCVTDESARLHLSTRHHIR